MSSAESTTKICSQCKLEKLTDDFYRRRDRNGVPRYLDPMCKLCRCKAAKRSRERNPDVHKRCSRDWKKKNAKRVKQINNASRRRSNEARRLRMIAAYGGKCACCGESDPHFLTADHVSGSRPAEHKKISSVQLMALLEREGFPGTCQLLCWNCNCAKSRYGACPHSSDFQPYFRSSDVLLRTA